MREPLGILTATNHASRWQPSLSVGWNSQRQLQGLVSVTRVQDPLVLQGSGGLALNLDDHATSLLLKLSARYLASPDYTLDGGVDLSSPLTGPARGTSTVLSAGITRIGDQQNTSLKVLYNVGALQSVGLNLTVSFGK